MVFCQLLFLFFFRRVVSVADTRIVNDRAMTSGVEISGTVGDGVGV